MPPQYAPDIYTYIYIHIYKRKEFNFQIIRYPNLSGNVPLYPSIGVFPSQLDIFCSINLYAEDFKNDIIQLVNTLHSQRYDLKMI